jgi:hypothetical protein
MELDELKNLWKKQDDAFRPRNEAEITAMLKGKSKSIVAKLKRSVWFELVLTLLAGFALLFYAVTLESSALKNTSIAILLMFLVYTVYYVKKLLLLQRFEIGGENVRTNLENLISNLTTYLRYYKLSYTILYPVYFVLGVIFGGLRTAPDRFFDILTEFRTIAILIALALAFYFSTVWLVDWFLKKLYGNHLQKLKQLLEDIHDKE